MMPTDHHAALGLGAHRKAIVLLNVGDDADEAIENIVAITSELFDKLSSDYLENLYLLGDSTTYNRAVFDQQFHRWRQRNLHRLSLIRPILETKNPNEVDLVVIVTHRVPYDLDDYDCSPWREKILLLPAFEGLNNDEWGYLKGDFRRTTRREDVVDQVKDAVCKVEIGSSMIMPYAWSNMGFKWEKGYLVAEELEMMAQSEGYECTLSALAPPNTVISARVTYRSGVIVNEFPLQPISPSPPEHYILTQREASILAACLMNQTYDCPCCGERHTKEVVYCQSKTGDVLDNLLGNLVYIDLESQISGKWPQYLLFVRQASQFTAFPFYNSILRIASNLVACRQEGHRVQVHAYDRHALTWRPQGRYLKQYEELSPGTHVVML